MYFSTYHLHAILAVIGISTKALTCEAKDLIVFGDSLSDTGNRYIETGSTSPPLPYGLQNLALLATGDLSNLVEGENYFPGRLTNGRVWVEYLAEFMGVESPSPSLEGGNNYAYSGAGTGDDRIMWKPDLLGPDSQTTLTGGQSLRTQIQDYLGDIDAPSSPLEGTILEGASCAPNLLNFLNFVHLPNGLVESICPASNGNIYVIAAGGNDFLLRPTYDIEETVENIKDSIEDLIEEAGATKIIVAGIPNLDAPPAIITRGTSSAPDVRVPLEVEWDEITTQYNEALFAMIDQIQAEEKYSVQLIKLDVSQMLEDIETSGLFTNLDSAFVNEANGSFPPGVDPNTFFFWDGLHPNTVAHGRLACAVCVQLSSNGISCDRDPGVCA